MQNELTTTEQQNGTAVTAFANDNAFNGAVKMAQMLCSSDIVPATYRGKEKVGNCVIALEMAQRIGASPLAVMQNLYVVQGKPAWSATFIIAGINSCGRFSPLRFELSGEGDDWGCMAWAYDKATGDRLEGPRISIKMAKAEGWFSKNGSKWLTMPELMIRYRAAAFWGRLYAPELMMGIQTREEVEDTAPAVHGLDGTEPTPEQSDAAQALAAELSGAGSPVIPAVEAIADEQMVKIRELLTAAGKIEDDLVMYFRTQTGSDYHKLSDLTKADGDEAIKMLSKKTKAA